MAIILATTLLNDFVTGSLFMKDNNYAIIHRKADNHCSAFGAQLLAYAFRAIFDMTCNRFFMSFVNVYEVNVICDER